MRNHLYFWAIMVAGSASISLSCLAQQNPCPTNWVWKWGDPFGPAAPISVTAQPWYYVNQPITIPASVPTWTNGSKVKYDANGCATNVTIVSLAASPTNWWIFRYPIQPVTAQSGPGLTASFTATNFFSTTELQFWSSNYNDSVPLQPPASFKTSTSVYIKAYKFVHECEFDCPGDPLSRTDLGAGEYVNLSVLPGPPSTTWTYTGVGEIGGTTESENFFHALDTPGNATITVVTSDGARFTNSFTVWTPSGLLFAGDTTRGLTGTCPSNAGFFSVYYYATISVLPDYVNFNYLTLQEGGCQPVATGFATNSTWPNHTAGNPKAMGGLCPIPGMGTLTLSGDYIGIQTWSPPPPFVPKWGSVVWPIPWTWTIGGGWPDHDFRAVDQEGVMDTVNGVTTWTVSKNHQVSAAIEDVPGATPYWVWIQ